MRKVDGWQTSPRNQTIRSLTLRDRIASCRPKTRHPIPTPVATGPAILWLPGAPCVAASNSVFTRHWRYRPAMSRSYAALVRARVAASPGREGDDVARQRLGVALALLHEGRELVSVETQSSADASGAGKLASGAML